MRTLFALIFLALFSTGLFSQTELSEINDPDGFTNIRKEKSSKSEVIAKVESGDFFYSEPEEEESWWKVITLTGQMGYMHKRRIQLIKNTDQEYRKKLIMTALGTRKMDQLSVKKAEEAEDKELAHKMRDNLEKNVHLIFNPTLPVLEDYFCEYKDGEMLDSFIRVLNLTRNSANESPSYALGGMYICNPDMIVKHIKKQDKEHQKELIFLLDWGFQNVAYDQEENIEGYDKLKARIERLQSK